MPGSAKYQLLVWHTMQFPLEHSTELAGPTLLPCDDAGTWENQKQLSPSLTAQNGLKRKQTINPKCTPLLYLCLSLFGIRSISITNSHLAVLQVSFVCWF